MKKISKNSGFTLIELIVSIGIIGIVSGISIANYKKGGSSNELISAAQILASEFRTVQGYALSSKEYVTTSSDPGRGWGIMLTKGTSTFSIFIDKNEDNKLRNLNKELYQDKEFSLSGNVKISEILLDSIFTLASDPNADNVVETSKDYFYITNTPPDPTISLGGTSNRANPTIDFSETAKITLSHRDGDSIDIDFNIFGLIDVGLIY